jgi:hypothetical protein
LDAKVPEEYLTNATIRDKLPNIKLNKLHEDVLFYLFYNCPGEVYQVAAASELFAFVFLFFLTFLFHSFSTDMRGIGGFIRSSDFGYKGLPTRHLRGKLVAHTKDVNTTFSTRSSGEGFVHTDSVFISLD